MSRCPKCQYDDARQDTGPRVVCPECGCEYSPGEEPDLAGPSIAASAVFTIALAAMAGLLALTWPMSDAWFTRARIPWWYAGVVGSIVAVYVPIARLFPALFPRWWPRQNPGFVVYLLFASGLYAVIAFGLLWMRGMSAWA
ncbi:MAG: hypothetical protein RIE32_14310 [Phycisphaerales bacterium]